MYDRPPEIDFHPEGPQRLLNALLVLHIQSHPRASHDPDTRCTIYLSQQGYANVWLIMRPDAWPSPGAPLPLSGPVVGTVRNSTGMSTVTGIEEIFNFRSSVALRANGSGFTRGALRCCQDWFDGDAEEG